ncbi:MAG: peptidoglycan-binding domain-containing protein [Stellaceae bacterium]
MKSLILATAAVLALGIGGAGAATVSSHQGTAMAPQARTSRNVTGAAHHRSLTVKEAQRALRRDSLYHGHIDGIIGPRTRHALAQYQKMKGLPVTANLNHQTMEALMGSRTVGVGSSMHRHAITGQGTLRQTPPPTPAATGASGQTTGMGSTPMGSTSTGTTSGMTK